MAGDYRTPTTIEYGEIVLSGALGSMFGGFVGAIKGTIGSIGVPTSIRWSRQRLPSRLEEVLGGSFPSLFDKAFSAAYTIFEIGAELGTEFTILSKAFADLFDGNSLSYAYLFIPNIIFGIYEIRRARHPTNEPRVIDNADTLLSWLFGESENQDETLL